MAEPIGAGVTHDIVIEIGGEQYGFMLDRRNPYGLQDSNPAIPNIPNTPLSLADYNIWTIDAQDSWLHGFGFGFNRDDMGYDESSGVETRMSGYLQLLPRIFDWKVWANAGFTINDIEEWAGGLLGYHLVALARGNLEGLTYYYENPNPQWGDKPDPDEDSTNETVNALLALKDYLLIALNGTNERMVKWNGGTGWTGAGNPNNPPKNYGFLERGGGYLWGAEKGTNLLHHAGAEDGSDFEGGETDPNVIKVGVAAPPIIGLCWWRDNLRVAKPDKLYFVDRENLVARTEIPDFAESSTPAMWTGVEPHFESMCPGPGGLWFTIQNRIYRWSGSTLTDVTPPNWGLWPPYVRWHRFHNLQRFNEYMYAVGEVEDNADEYLLCYANGSWHLLYHLSFGQTDLWQVSKVAISRKYGRFVMAVKDTTAPPWWASAYQRRKKVTVSGAADTLTTAQINLSGAGALDIYQDSQPDAGDVRICFWDGQDWEELNRNVVTFTSSAIDIRFKVKHQIAQGYTDDRYYIYYKNSSATNPPKDLALVYITQDNFDTEQSWVAPSQWSVSQQFNFIRVSPYVFQGGSGKSVTFNSWPTYGCSMRQTHNACSGGLIRYTFYGRMEVFSGTKILEFRIWDERGNIGPMLRFWRTSAGVYQILATDQNTWKVIMTISATTWYKVEITADLDAKTYDVKIDDVLKADNYGFWAGSNVSDLRTFYVSMPAGGPDGSALIAKAHFDTYCVERPTYASCSVGTEQTVSAEGKIKNFRLRDTVEPYDDYDTGIYRYVYSVRYDFRSQVISKSFWEFIARVNNVNAGGRDVQIAYRIDDIGDWINISTLTTDGLQEFLFSMPPPKGKWIQFRIGLKTDSATESPYVDTFGVRVIARPKTTWAQRYNLLIGDGIRRRDGKFDDRSPSDSLQVLTGARDSEEPVTIYDFWRGKRYGYITSAAIGAVRFLDNMQTAPKKGGAVGSAQIVFVPLRAG